MAQSDKYILETTQKVRFIVFLALKHDQNIKVEVISYFPVYQGKKGIFGLDTQTIYARTQIAKSLPKD